LGTGRTTVLQGIIHLVIFAVTDPPSISQPTSTEPAGDPKVKP
jgi:hypothetical protein